MEMQWTRESPTKEGFYWTYNGIRCEEPSILSVDIPYSDGKLMVYDDDREWEELSKVEWWMGPLPFPPDPPQD